MMAVKYKCKYCGADNINFDCSCEQKIINQDMWNKDHNEIIIMEKQNA